MKAVVHPTNYRPVIFDDVENDAKFLIGSTVDTTATGTWVDGKTYTV